MMRRCLVLLLLLLLRPVLGDQTLERARSVHSLFLSSRLLPVVVVLLSERGEGGNGFVSLSLSLSLSGAF